MKSPNCPDHDRLVLDLALGRLDDDAAIAAERVSESCPVCRAWWQEQFDGGVADLVGDAVAAGFTGLELPARRSGRGLMAAAAAVVMTLGAGTLWVAQRGTTVEDVAAPRTASIQTLDFERPETVAEFARVEVPDPDTTPEAPALPPKVTVQETLVAHASQLEVAEEDASKALFVGSFESGDLGAWVPKT